MKAITTAIGSLKGGVGKTKTTTNIAVDLAVNHGYKVLLIDCDPQSNTTSDFGIDTSGIFTLGDVVAELREGLDVHQTIITNEDTGVEGLENLHVIPASYKTLEGAERYLESPEGLYRLKELVIEPLANEYDYIFIDTPPRLGALTRAAMAAADYCVPVLDPTSDAFVRADSFAEQVRSVAKYTTADPVIPFWLAVNWASSAEERKIIEAIESDNSIHLMGTRLPASLVPSKAVLEYQLPVMALGWEYAYCKAVSALVQEVLAMKEYARPTESGQ